MSLIVVLLAVRVAIDKQSYSKENRYFDEVARELVDEINTLRLAY